MAEVTVGRKKPDVAPSFCYLGDWLSLCGSCELATVTGHHATWGNFNKLLRVVPSRLFPISPRERVCNSCGRDAMLHATETWATVVSDLHHLQCNGRALIRWMCGVTTKDQVSLRIILERMQLGHLAKVLHTDQLRWHCHEEHSDCCLTKVHKLNPTGSHGCGHPKYLDRSEQHGLPSTKSEIHLSYRKALSGRLTGAVRLDSLLNYRLIKSYIN